MLYFIYLGRNPAEPISTKICLVADIPNAITCAKFQSEIFRDYYLTGVEFSILILIFCMGHNRTALMRCM